MIQAKMTDTGEMIIGCSDMVHSILTTVYRCDSDQLSDAIEAARSGNATIVGPRRWDGLPDSYGFRITRYQA